MTRVLQIFDDTLDADARSAAATVARALGAGFEITIRPLNVAGVPLAALRLWRRREQSDVVHAVGSKSLATAVLGTRAPIVFTPGDFPTVRTARWVRAALTQRDMTVVTATESARRFFVTRGVDPARCRVIRPSAGGGALKRDARLRKALGFDDAHRVILAVGETTHAANHGLAAWVASLLHVMEPSHRLLLWGGGRASGGLSHLRSSLLDASIVTIARDKLGHSTTAADLSAAADVALVTAVGPIATVPVARAMAAGVPIVSTTTPAVSELIEDRHTALLVRDASPRDLARRVVDLYDDDDLRWRIADRARAEAFDFYTPSRAITAWRELLTSAAAVSPAGIA